MVIVTVRKIFWHGHTCTMKGKGKVVTHVVLNRVNLIKNQSVHALRFETVRNVEGSPTKSYVGRRHLSNLMRVCVEVDEFVGNLVSLLIIKSTW